MDRNTRASALKAEIRRRLWRAAAHEAIGRLDCKPADRTVLHILIDHSDEQGRCRLWLRTIARKTPFATERWIQLSLARLRDAGLVQVERRQATHGGFVANGYTLKLDVAAPTRALDELLELAGSPGDQVITRGRSDDHQVVRAGSSGGAAAITSWGSTDRQLVHARSPAGDPPITTKKERSLSETSSLPSISDRSFVPSGDERTSVVENLTEHCREVWPHMSARALRPHVARALDELGDEKSVRRYIRRVARDPSIERADIPALVAFAKHRLEQFGRQLRKVKLVNPTTPANARPMPNDADHAASLKRAASKGSQLLAELGEQPARKVSKR